MSFNQEDFNNYVANFFVQFEKWHQGKISKEEFKSQYPYSNNLTVTDFSRDELARLIIDNYQLYQKQKEEEQIL